MEREKLTAFLRKFNFKFEENQREIIVSLDFRQKIYIDFSNPNSVKIKDRLVGWNFLTGMIPMSLKSAMIYNFIGLLVCGIIFFFLQLQHSDANLTVIILVLGIWLILFFTYYLAKLEIFKQTVFRILE